MQGSRKTISVRRNSEGIDCDLEFQPQKDRRTIMPVKIGINGFGRIGRNIFRASLGDPSIEIVAVNDVTDPKTLAYLLKYDSILGNLPNAVKAGVDSICVDNKSTKVFKLSDPAEIDWSSVDAQIVIEATGHFAKNAGARSHLRGTVKKVIISAPSSESDLTVVLGVNEKAYDPARHNVISNASCTTNCLAPVAKRSEEHTSELQSRFGISYAVFCLKKKTHKKDATGWAVAPESAARHHRRLMR